MNGTNGASSRVSDLQALVQGGQRRRVAVPEPPPGPPHVPVRQVVDVVEPAALPARAVSKSSSAASTATTSRCSSDSDPPVEHRALGAPGRAACGVQPPLRAYSDGNDAVYQ